MPTLVVAHVRAAWPGRNERQSTVVGEPGDTVTVTVLTTEDLTASQRSSVIEVCVSAHDDDEFKHLFTYIPSGGRHFLTYRGPKLVSHAVVTTRWVQPDGHRALKTAYVDAVATSPMYQGLGNASTTMNRLAAEVGDYEIGCLQTDRVAFHERLGWELWRWSLAGRSDDGLIPTPEQRGATARTILPFASVRSFNG